MFLIYGLLGATLDRLRGTRSYLVLPYAFATGYMFDSITVGLMFILGESLGWGGVVNAMLTGKKTQGYDITRSWQSFRMGQHPHLSALYRGFLWGLPMGLVPKILFMGEVKNTLFLIPLMAISFYLPLLVFRCIKNLSLKQKWEMQEYVRGFLFFIGVYFLTL